MSINPPDTLLTAWVGVLRPFAEAGLAVAADQTLLALNPAAEQFFGCPLAEAYRQPVQRLLPDWAGPEAVGLTGCRWDGTLFPVTARRLSAADAAGVTILFLEAGVPADETFLRVFEASPLPMALTDLSTHRYAEVNEALLQSLGYDRSDVIGRTPASLGLFAIPEQRDQALRTIQTDGRLRNFEVAIRTKAGEVRSGLFSAEYFQAQGRKYLLTVMEDITDRQRAEAERRAAEAKFRSYIEHAPLAIFVADERGRFVDFNPAALALLGYSAAQLSQMSIPDLIAPPDLEAGRRHFQTVVAEGVADGELRFCHQAGRTVWASVHAVRLGPDRFMAFCQDVSQRRLTEMALRESEAQYRLLADNTADVIWVIDLATMRFTYMSPSAERLRGYGVEETLAQTLAEVLTPASLAAVEARLPARAAAFLAGDPAAIRESMELEQVRRDGSTVCTEVATTLVRKPDGGLEVVGTTRDISDRKRMELELRHSEERYRLITAVVSDYAFSTRVGPAGELTHDWVAGAFEGITGYTFAEYVAAGGWQALVHPADRVVDTRDQNVILNNQPVRSQVRVLTKSGAERWVQIYAHPVWSDSEQRVVGIHGAVQDITERRRAQEALRESEARYRSLFETMADGVVYQDAAGRIVHANPAAEHLLGLSLAQMRGRTSTDPSWQALHEDGTPFSGEAHPAMVALRTGRPVSNVVMGVIHPGEARHRWIVVNAIPQFQPGAAAAFQVFTTFTDITKRKEIEAALRESEERYRVLFEGTGEGIVIVDPAGQQFQYANPAMCALFGYTLAELQSLSVLGLHPDEAAARVQAEFSAIAAGRRTRASAIPCRRRDGTHFYADIAGYPMRVAGRDVLVGFFTDVTERRRAEALLQARLRLSDRAAQAPLDELLRLTLDEAEVVTDSQIGYFHFVEPDQVTLSLQTWSTRTLAELCTAEGHSRHYPVDQAGVWADSLRQGQPLIFNDYANLPRRQGWPAGHAPVRRFMTVPVQRQGQVVAMVGVGNKAADYDQRDLEALTLLANEAWDLILRQRAENALRESLAELKQAHRELEELNHSLEQRVQTRTDELRTANLALARAARLKDEFLASMSHELRTPLTGILGLSEALQYSAYGPLNEKQLTALGNIESSGRHLLALINDILDLSKIEAGKLELQLEVCELGAVCQASLQLVKGLAQQKRQSVSFAMDPAVLMLWADSRRLKQMLVNLLSNAVKFTAVEGQLGLEVRAAEADQQIRLTVWDHGVGIRSEDQPRLFQPFIQLDAGLARPQGGTGLGLSLVRRLAELHGGGVTVESELGQGSRFTVHLPWAGAQLAGSGEAGGNLTDHGRALIVSQDTRAAASLAGQLQMLGVAAVRQEAAEAAVERVGAEPPAVICLILEPAERAGWELLAALQADPATHSIPVLALAGPADLARAEAAGVAGTLAVPHSLADLRAVWQRLTAPAGSPVPAEAERAPEAEPLVLVVDDNDINRGIVADYLTYRRFRVLEARSGLEALELAPQSAPSLIVMDVQMPGLDGLETIRRLRAHPDATLAAVPIIAMTALAMPGDQERCLAAGANAYLSRPVPLEKVAQQIQALLIPSAS